jgi:polyphosphate kinase 2 (PPK2 family)
VAAGEHPVALLREALAVEVLLDAAWRPAELLGWRHDDDGRCQVRVRLDWDGGSRVLWTPMALLRLPEPVAAPVPPTRRAAPPPVPPPVRPAVHRAARPPVRRPERVAPERLAPGADDVELLRLQVELLKLLAWVREEGRRVVVVLEGARDAGQGATAAALVEHLDPRAVTVVPAGAPDRAAHLPAAGRLVVFDRSWCGPATRDPAGRDAPLRDLTRLEESLAGGGVHLVKLWFSVARADADPAAEAALVGATSTAAAPWTVLAADDERRACIEALRHVLSVLDYRGRRDDVVGRPDPLLVAPVPPSLLPTG